MRVQRQLIRTVIILVLVTVVGGVLLRRQAARVAQIARAPVRADTALLAPSIDSATTVATAVMAHDAYRQVRGAPPQAVRVASYEPDSTGVLVRLMTEQSDSAVWVRVYPDGRTTMSPSRPPRRR